MSEQLPQYSESMDYDEISYFNLRRYFQRGKYSITKDKTVIGDREFGVDWRIELLNEQRGNTGIDFIIQSKTTEEMERGDYISLEIEAKNINYLAKKTVPVFIHLVRRDDDAIGYWLWFQEWHSNNYSQRWYSEQGKVTIKIPVSQKLSEEAVKQIVNIVSDENLRTRIRQAVDRFNRLNPDFHFSSPEFIDGNIISVAQPKHDDAVIHIDVDEIGNEAIRKALEEGYSVEFSVLSTDAPSPYETVLPETGDLFLRLIPYSDTMPLPIQIVIYGQQDQPIHNHPTIQFMNVRPGSIEREFWGQAPDEAIIYTMVSRVDAVAGKLNIRLGFLCPITDDPCIVKNHFGFYEKLRDASRISMTHEPSGKQFGQIHLSNLAPIRDDWTRVIDALCSLRANHGIQVTVPTEITDDLVWAAEMSNDILTNGKSRYKNNPQSPNWKAKISEVENIIELLVTQGYIYLAVQDTYTLGFEILNAKIDLGTLRTVYCVTNLNNIDEIRQKLLSGTLGEDDMVELQLGIDLERSFTISEKA